MKTKEFFEKVGAHIPTEEFKAFIATLPEDHEMPDELFSAFENTYLTRDRARSDKDVLRQLRPQLLDPIDKEIKSILTELGTENTHVIDKEADTYRKIALLTNEIKGAIAKAGKGSESNEEFKKKIQAKEEEISALVKKLETVGTEWEGKFQTVQKDYETKLHDFQRDNELEKRSAEYIFADAYEKTRKQLQSALLGDLKKSHKLQLVDIDGTRDIHLLNEDGSRLFNGNTPVTLKSKLDEIYKPFLKVSNGTEGQQQNQDQATKRFNVGDGAQKPRQGVKTTVG